MHARSTDSTDRPGHRPVGGCLAALAVIAPLVGSPPAWAGDEPSSTAPAAALVAAPEVDAPAALAVVPPAPPEPPAASDVAPPAAPDPSSAPDVAPPAAPDPPSASDVAPPAAPDPPSAPDVTPPKPPDPPDVAPPETPDLPAATDAAETAAPDEVRATAPAGGTPSDHDQPAPPPSQSGASIESPAPPDQNALAVAGNSSTVFQVIWQVQQGCQTYCWATSMLQGAVQEASTTQNASALAAGTPTSIAQAGNESLTVQFVWQQQLGCVAFCYDTSQTQLALQIAETLQIAVALAGVGASAGNLAETIQQVWQYQQGCEQECYGTSQTQIAAQQQTTSQTAIAVADEPPNGSNVSLPAPGDGGVPTLPGWLIALALNVGATIQTIFQYDEAACLSHCGADSQSQWAGQQALTVQDAVAEAGPPPPDDAPAEPPVEQPVTPPEPERVLAQAPLSAPSGDKPQAVSVSAPPARVRLSVHGRGWFSSLKHDPERRGTRLAMTVRRESNLASTGAAFGGDGGGEPPSPPSAGASNEPLDASFVKPLDAAPAPDRAAQQQGAAGLAPESSPADQSDRRVLIGLLAGSLMLAAAGVSLMRRRSRLGVRP